MPLRIDGWNIEKGHVKRLRIQNLHEWHLCWRRIWKSSGRLTLAFSKHFICLFTCHWMVNVELIFFQRSKCLCELKTHFLHYTTHVANFFYFFSLNISKAHEQFNSWNEFLTSRFSFVFQMFLFFFNSTFFIDGKLYNGKLIEKIWKTVGKMMIWMQIKNWIQMLE